MTPPSAMILAAGEGTRLRPLTLDRPKPMLPVAGTPVIQHIVAWLHSYGITRIAINLHHHPEAVRSYFGDGRTFGVSITYSVEEAILGTAGGARAMASLVPGPWIVIYGDTLTDLNLDALLREHERHDPLPHVTLALFHAPDPSSCGITETDEKGRVRRFLEKPAPGQIAGDLANAGVLVVDPPLLDATTPGTFSDFGNDLLPAMLADGKPIFGWTIPSDAYLIDIGTPANYKRAQREWPMVAARAFEERT